MTDNERGEGAAVERNGGLAGEGRHRLGEEKPSLLIKMGPIRGASKTEEVIGMLMISKNSEGEKMKAMTCSCADDARFSKNKKEKEKQGKRCSRSRPREKPREMVILVDSGERKWAC